MDDTQMGGGTREIGIPDNATESIPISKPTLPGYNLSKKLGEGGMGEVYLAESLSSGRLYAVKFLLLDPSSHSTENRIRFRREIRMMMSLEHANIVEIFDQREIDGRPYFIMEYARTTLRDALRSQAPMPASRVLDIVAGVVAALDCLASVDIVHRDLKPENILLDDDCPKVTDFGISVLGSEVGQLTRTRSILGTLDYMAPEQRTRLRIDSRSDQYSLSVIVYEMLTGKVPLGIFSPPSSLDRRLHPEVDFVLGRALQENPADRYPTVSEFFEALRRALSRRPKRNLVLSWLIGVALLFLAGALFWGFVIEKAETENPSATPHDSPPHAIASNSEPVRKSDELERTNELDKSDELEKAKKAKEAKEAKVVYYLELGDKHLAAGLNTDAESCYTEAIRLAPGNPLPYLKRAYLYKTKSLNENAIVDLEKALELDDTLPDGWTGLGSLYVRLKDYAKAIEVLDEGILKIPAYGPAFAYRGWAHYKLGRLHLALRDLDKAIEIDRTCAVAYQFRALLHTKNRKTRAARADFEKAIEFMPSNPFMHGGLARLLAGAKNSSSEDLDRALRHARIACRLTRHRDWSLLRILGRAHAAKGEYAEAIRHCRQALGFATAVQQTLLQADLRKYESLRDKHSDAP